MKFNWLNYKIAPSIVLIAALILQVWLCFFQPLVPGLVVHWWHGTQDEFLHGWKSYDNVIIQSAGATDGGNVSLMLLRLDPENPDHVLFAQGLLCRGSYAIYPHRVWAADGMILNGGADAIKARFNPSTEWLRTHDVRGVVAGIPNASGQVVAQIFPPVGAGR